MGLISFTFIVIFELFWKIDQQVSTNVENITWHTGQAHLELVLLQRDLTALANGEAVNDPKMAVFDNPQLGLLQLRIDVLRSRYNVLTNGKTAQQASLLSGYNESVRALDIALDDAERLITEVSDKNDVSEHAQSILQMFVNVEPRLRALSSSAVLEFAQREIQLRGALEKAVAYIVISLVIAIFGLGLLLILIVQKLKSERRHSKRVSLLNHRLQEADSAKGQFLAQMSHELRTPLNAIIGFAQMIEGQVLGKIENEKYIEYSADIAFSANHLVSLVNDILDLSKIEAGKLDIKPTRFSIDTAIRDAVSLTLKNSTRSDETIHVDLDPDLEYLTTDLRSFRQIMINLLSNADKYTDKDKMISVLTRRARDHETVIEVSDEGVGIPPQDLERVLEPFNQARQNVEIAHSGTGLGLTISKSLMELNGGSLKIKSKLDKGTSVILTFPNHGC